MFSIGLQRTGAALFSTFFPLFVAGVTVFGLAHPGHGVVIEVQRVILPSTFGQATFQPINFVSSSFLGAGITPVVLTIATNAGGNPCTVRIQNVTASGFEAACVEGPGSDGPHIAMDLHYIAIEPGVHGVPATVGGVPGTVTLAAGTVSTSAVQHNCGAPCGATGATSVSFGTTFSTPPALLLQIQTTNSESGIPPAGPSMPFLVGTTVNAGGSPVISTTGFDVALERSEVAAGTVSPEVVGWLAAAPTAGCTLLDFSTFGGPPLVPFEALISGNVVDGWADGCGGGEGVSFAAGCFASPPVVVGTKRTRNGTDGGWLRRCTAGFGTGAVRFTVDEDIASDGERSHSTEAVSVLAFDTDFSTPVGLAFFHAEPVAAGVRARWATSTEAGTVGFAFSVFDGNAWIAADGATEGVAMLAATGIDTTEPQMYSLMLAADTEEFAGGYLRLVETDRFGRRQYHGPFALGTRYGTLPTARAIDWPAVRAELGRFEASRQGHTTRGPSTEAELRVSETGLYRVTHEALVEAGIDLSGIEAADIALALGGEPVARRIVGASTSAVHRGAHRWTAGSSLEFWGRAVEGSLYTRTRVYRLAVARALARTMAVDRRRIPLVEPTRSYVDEVVDDTNRQYSFGSPNGDPWFRDALLAFGTAVTRDYPIEVDGLESGDEAARLVVDLWGVTDFPAAPDHHLQIAFNGVVLWDETFDGLAEVRVDVPLPAGLLVEGANALTLSLPADTGLPADLVHLERFGVRYWRHLLARQDHLTFRARGSVFAVSGFGSSDVVAYRISDHGPERLRRDVVPDGSGFTVRFRGREAASDTYVVATTDRLWPVDDIRPALDAEIPAGDADYLIVTHPSFAAGLDDLVALRRASGVSVLVVNVETIYSHYSDGVVSPESIRRFVSDAVRDRGTRAVLLVGADTYDYFDHLNLGSVSFVPTPYAQTDALVRFAPADALLADVDDDGLPDVPIGRLPVRTLGELSNVVAKILRHEREGPARTAVLVADGREPMTSFTRFSDELGALLPATWSRQRVSLDNMPVADARASLLAALEAGPGLVSYVGHSGPTRWTFDGLFSSSDAAALSNDSSPIVMQGGCWNTYHVQVSAATVAHRFLTGEHGAVAVVGPAVLTRFESERLLEVPFLEGLVGAGMTLGEALQAAKERLAQEQPLRRDALLGWTLLGDPLLRLEP